MTEKENEKYIASTTLYFYLYYLYTFVLRAGVIPQASGFNPFIGMGNVKQEVKQEAGLRFPRPPVSRAKTLVSFR